MLPSDRLRDKLITLDGKGYSAYKSIAGAYRFPRHVLYLDHVQPDPFAPPSLLRVQVDAAEAQLPQEWWATPTRKMALEDFLARRFRDVVRRVSRGRPPERGGDRRGGALLVDAGEQEILSRTACRVRDEHVELRLALGLPADGRKIQAKQAATILLEELPAAVEGTLLRASLDEGAARRHLETVEDHAALVEGLRQAELVAFVPDGAVLPRESGISDLPLGSHRAVPFRAPDALAVTLQTPHRGPVRGMGIPAGVTLIVGGGFHGKSTLLSALTRGVYPHLPGDGREHVAARPDLVKIRAEEGRRVARVDISAFVGPLPLGVDTAAFSTENASGSTSQAANLVEAIEAGGRVLVIDEDSSATNFMIRDELMQRLVPKALEPITPFVDQVRHLSLAHGISTVLVMGGSGDYFSVADTVILMDNYQPRVVTEEARRIAMERRDLRAAEGRPFEGARPRVPLPHGFNPYRDRRIRVDARGLRTIAFGRETIDLAAVEQIVDSSQTRAIGDAIFFALERGYFDGERTLSQVLDALEADLSQGGLEVLSTHEGHPGDYALPRRHEIAAAINRLRTLAVKQVE